MDQKYKFDGGKLQYRLLPPKALREAAEVLTYGASKYAAHSWVNVESERYLDALHRHLSARQAGEMFDQESGLLHLAHAAVNILFLLEREFGYAEMGEPLMSYYEEVVSKNSEGD